MARPPHETSRDYANPYRPLAVRLFNALGRVKPFDLDDLVAAATRSAGHERFASDAFREPLARLIESLHSTAKLSPIGRFMTAQHIAGGLATNLRAGELFTRHGALQDLELARPVMVCGLARSGTTLLQRMLAQLPGARAIPAWEAYDPIPARGQEPGGDPLADPRVKRQRAADKFLRWLSPDLFAVHPMDALAPEEEVLILANLFQSGVPESTYDVSDYAAWLEQQDPTPAYAWLADCMRVLQWQRPGDFWVLKSPHHLEWLDVVFNVFPDVTVIQTHRDPVQTVPSFCSLVAHGWGIMSDAIDPHVVGRHWDRKIDRMLTRALATRDARDGAGFVDVDYRDLLGDPLAVMARVCEAVGLPWDDSIRAKLQVWLANNRQHEHGLHRYAAEDFGLSAEGLASRYGRYRERFDLA
ncbi:hypothetical protein DB30_06323 [Enhygromyxa salina]|uniref:Sulfotransferase domain protein n=1 Tax=Enhygromyxa salina TaxID=215803 RepID=A0A0C2D3R3_9BACT|nr:sulfotransferase [Enhygromyxa salina]KIG14737.1 hypothetical protein DB30_06323 [Enhygromyxa salina]